MDRDFRIRIDLNFDSANERVARGLYRHAVAQIAKAINVNGIDITKEVGYVSLERCGHRLKLPCDEIERQEVV